MKSSTMRLPDAQRAGGVTIAVGVSCANRFGAARRQKRLLQVGLRIVGAAFAAMLPLASFAELSNDSLIGPGLRYRATGV